MIDWCRRRMQHDQRNGSCEPLESPLPASIAYAERVRKEADRLLQLGIDEVVGFEKILHDIHEREQA